MGHQKQGLWDYLIENTVYYPYTRRTGSKCGTMSVPDLGRIQGVSIPHPRACWGKRGTQGKISADLSNFNVLR